MSARAEWMSALYKLFLLLLFVISFKLFGGAIFDGLFLSLLGGVAYKIVGLIQMMFHGGKAY